MLKKFLVGTFVLLGVVGRVFAQAPAQTRADLEKERAEIQKQIEDVRRSLDETHKNKRETLGQLALLQRRLHLRESAIRNINDQINVIQGDMNESWRDILKLRAELDTLRIQYAQSIVFAYKNRSSYDFLNFIFSSTSFNDALHRIEYLKSYRAYREERAANISKTQALLQSKIDGLKVTRAEKDDALKKQSKERQTLEVEKREKDAVVTQLQGQEKELRKQMAVKQRQDAKLEGAITAAINRARREAMKEAARKNASDAKAASDARAAAVAANKTSARPSEEGAAPATLDVVKNSSKTVFSSDADIHLTGDFIRNKGKLPWPVTGTVSMSFGRHEYIKGIWHDNAGVTIDVQPGAAVKAVFEGEVQAIFNVGDVQAVMIRHGQYFTTYSNLGTVSVTKGEHVGTGQIIGRVGGEMATPQLEFVLSDAQGRNQDPERWLRR